MDKGTVFSRFATLQQPWIERATTLTIPDIHVYFRLEKYFGIMSPDYHGGLFLFTKVPLRSFVKSPHELPGRE